MQINTDDTRLIENIEPQPVPPPGGFWRRIAAFVIDILLLGLFCQLIGMVFSGFWYTVGPAGRLLGIAVFLIYFSFFNSRFGSGQTVGKRCLKLAVRNSHNQPVSLFRAFLRSLILAVPLFLNGWSLPFLNNAVLGWVAGILVFGFGIVIVYTMIFNRRSGQGLHDILCGTYVVFLKGKSIEKLPATAGVHRMVSGLLLLV